MAKINKNITDTLDIVCHSMGYAYALGMIDAIKQQKNVKIPFGRFYIIAPEDAGAGNVNLSDWQEVWQYGSNENADPLDKQDGVAPQTRCGNLLESQRAYIPDIDGAGNHIPKGFISSHSIENYKWIFKLTKDANGYVTPRQ